MRKKNICEVAVTAKMEAQNEKWRLKTKKKIKSSTAKKERKKENKGGDAEKERRKKMKGETR